MSETRGDGNESSRSGDGSTVTAKLDQTRTMPGGALVKTVPAGQRFMMTPGGQVITASGGVQNQVLAATTGQAQALSSSSGQPQTLKSGSTSTSQATVTRLSTVPIQSQATNNFHVPRGPAQVANITVPRSSVATPIVRSTTNLQAIGVASQHTIASGVANSSIVARPVLGVTPYLSTTCISSGQAQSQSNSRGTTVQQIRPPPIAVSTRVGVAGQIRPIAPDAQSTSQARPVLLHAAHKVTLTQAQVQMSDKAVIKGYTGQTARIGVVPTPPSGTSLSRITTSNLPPAMVSLHPAVLVPGGQTMPLKSATTQAKVITQPTHGSAMQISSVPASSVQQSAIAISSVVTRPVMIASAGGTMNAASVAGVVRPATPKVFQSASADQSNPVYIHAQPHKTQQGTTAVGNVVSLASTIYSIPAGNYDSNFHVGMARTLPQTTNTTQPRPLTSQVSQSSDTITSVSGILPLATVASLAQGLTPKANTSPRPSILRKRDPEGAPSKAQKNLSQTLSSLTVATPSSPPSPPKRPESGNSGQSSGGSTTISATSSPGQGDPESPPFKQEPPPSHEDERPPPEMSPRKKPRKQQLTGTQLNEKTFSEDEMEFISEDKISRDGKDEEKDDAVEKVMPRRTMSLLNSYKHTWKPRNNHFMRYTDIKVKEEKKLTLTELANQKHTTQKLNGWKVVHLGTQMEDMLNSENEFFSLYTSLLTFMEGKQEKAKGKDLEDGMSRVNERIKANFQRCKVVKDQIIEARAQVMKLFDHKIHVTEIMNRCASKRSSKKRERV